jgi:hypothetical protein
MMRRWIISACAAWLACASAFAQGPTPPEPILNLGPAIAAALPAALAAPPCIGCTTPNTGAFSTLTTTGTITAGTTVGSTAKPGFLAFNTYRGDATKPWFTGGNWAFGWNPTTLANGAIRPLTVQRDAAYTGALVGSNPGALLVTNNVGANVTGLENTIIGTINIAATAGLYGAGEFTANKQVPGAGAIAFNIVGADQSARKSSVAGSMVVDEHDLNASGPDDGQTRVNMDVTYKEDPTGGASSDGATTFSYGGIRVRGGALYTGQTGHFNAPALSITAFAATTWNSVFGGLVGSFTTPFLADGATGAAYSATSAVQTLVTSASFLAGVTTITLTNLTATASYVWPGALMTGVNVPANTHVLTQSYDGVSVTTITIDTPIAAGGLTNGEALTFTNAIGTGFKTGGYLTTAAFQSPNFLVDPVGVVTGAAYKAGAVAGVTCPTGAPTASFASVGGIITHC